MSGKHCNTAGPTPFNHGLGEDERVQAIHISTDTITLSSFRESLHMTFAVPTLTGQIAIKW